MAKIYADLIKRQIINPKTNNPYTIDDVPNQLKQEVMIILNIKG